MKHLHKLLSLVLVLTLVLGLSLTAFAADSYTITITPNAKDKAAHTYEAYQIFKGDLTEETDTDGNVTKRSLSNISWGSNVDTSKLGTLATALEALRENKEAEGYVALTADSTAAQFAEVLAELNAGHDSGKAQAVADAFGAVLTGSAAGTGTADLSNEETTDDNAEISVTEAGYYLVKDRDDSLNGKEAAYTRYILQVVSNVTVAAKSEVPSIDKKIQDGENLVNTATASIGDEIPFVLTSAVPDMTGYEKYYFVVNDTLCEGLTFNADDIEITVGGTTLTADDYTVTVTKITEGENAGKTAVKIVLKDFYNKYNEQTGDAIVIKYTATLNEKADITATGNPNEVTLTYSNDPNFEYDMTPGHDEPGSNEPTGETPKSLTKTFTTGIKLIKVDSKDASKTLTGAKFQISGTKVNVTLINSEVYHKVADEAAEITDENRGEVYYRLKDGTYTKDAPTDETADKYESTEDKYLKITEVTKEVTSEDVEAVGWVDENGVLTFVGLGEGDYQITELVAPEGYNLLTAPITVHIGANLDDDAMTCVWEPTLGTGEDATALELENNLIKLQVRNSQGPELPTTGGIGTTLFYVIGALLVLSTGILLVVRKRTALER